MFQWQTSESLDFFLYNLALLHYCGSNSEGDMNAHCARVCTFTFLAEFSIWTLPSPQSYMAWHESSVDSSSEKRNTLCRPCQYPFKLLWHQNILLYSGLFKGQFGDSAWGEGGTSDQENLQNIWVRAWTPIWIEAAMYSFIAGRGGIKQMFIKRQQCQARVLWRKNLLIAFSVLSYLFILLKDYWTVLGGGDTHNENQK